MNSVPPLKIREIPHMHTDVIDTKKHIKMIWHYGGLRAHIYLLMILIGYLIMPLIILTALFFMKPIGVFITVLAIWMVGLSFLIGFSEITIENAKIIKETVNEIKRHGWDIENEYTSSYLDYLEKHGKNGWAPGNLWWGFAYCFLFYVTIIFSYMLSDVYTFIYESWSWLIIIMLAISSLLVFLVMHNLKNLHFNRRASEKGYDLQKLRLMVIEKESQNKSIKSKNRLIKSIIIGLIGLGIILSSVLFSYQTELLRFVGFMIIVYAIVLMREKKYMPNTSRKPIKTKRMIEKISNNLRNKK